MYLASRRSLLAGKHTSQPVWALLPGLVDYWDSTAGLKNPSGNSCINGDPVQTWIGRQYGLVFGQTTTAKQPVFSSAPTGFNGKPAVNFTVDDCLTSPAVSLGAQTIYFVVRLSGTPGMIWEQGPGGANPSSYLYGTTGNTRQVSNSAAVNAAGQYTANWAETGTTLIVASTFDGTAAGLLSGFYVNGANVALTAASSGNPGVVPVSAAMNLGARNNAASLPVTGYFGAVGVYASTHAVAQMLSMSSYLNSLYAAY